MRTRVSGFARLDLNAVDFHQPIKRGAADTEQLGRNRQRAIGACQRQLQHLAFGAQAYVAAVLFYELRIRNDWATLPAFVVVVLIASPLMGLLLELLIFRHLRTASPLAR